jgi:hypothetical protein
MGCDRTNVRAELLAPWLKEHGTRAADWFAMIGELPGDPYPALAPEDLWTLYAFSRVNDALRMDFQPFRAASGAPESWREWLGLHVDDYRHFVERCGLTACLPTSAFTPFLHEIVTVEQSLQASEPISLAAELWPVVMAGRLLISRAGVCISAGRAHIVREAAENSTLYWSHLRRNRRCSDLSVGWGSNSQWATSFRRDYFASSLIHLNVDALHDINCSEDKSGAEMTSRQRIELLVQRCLVTESVADDKDLWPFDDKLSICSIDFIGTIVAQL